MFELHVRQRETPTNPHPQSEGDDIRPGCLEFRAYFRFPLFPVREAPAHLPHGARASRREQIRRWLGDCQAAIDHWVVRWYQPLKWGLLGVLIAGLAWGWHQDGLGLLAANGWSLSSDWKSVLGMFIAAFIVPYYVLQRRPMFRVRIHLLHPEAPDPYPTPRLGSRQNVHIAMRVTRPAVWRELSCQPSRLLIYTDRRGKPITAADADQMLAQHCLRILRYAFLSRLPGLTKDAASAATTTPPPNRTKVPSPDTPQTVRSGPAVSKPEVPSVEKSATAFKLAVYAHYPQLRWYVTLVLGAAAYGSLWHFTDITKGVAILTGLAWLFVTIRQTSRSVLALSRWLHFSDSDTWSPGYDLHRDGHWHYIPPDHFNQRDEAEVGISHDRLIAVAVTVLFGLYLTMLQLFSVNVTLPAICP